MARRKHGPTVLITGANRGLGLEFTRQYAADGWRVIATCRQPGTAKALTAIKGDVRVRALDTTDSVQIGALARALKSEAIDLLINNAGIYGPRKSVFGRIDRKAWRDVFEVNVMGPMIVSEALANHIARGTAKTIIAVTSMMGSLSLTKSGGDYMYRTSKSALNMAMKGLSFALKPRGITVAIIHPGWVRTDMGGTGANLSPEESVTAMRRVIAGLKPDHTGRFFNYDGKEIPW